MPCLKFQFLGGAGVIREPSLWQCLSDDSLSQVFRKDLHLISRAVHRTDVLGVHTLLCLHGFASGHSFIVFRTEKSVWQNRAHCYQTILIWPEDALSQKFCWITISIGMIYFCSAISNRIHEARLWLPHTRLGHLSWEILLKDVYHHSQKKQEQHGRTGTIK